MSQQSIEVRAAKCHRQPREIYEEKPRVRIYRCPGRIALQIRTGKGYAHALLTYDEAQAIASWLQFAALEKEEALAVEQEEP